MVRGLVLGVLIGITLTLSMPVAGSAQSTRRRVVEVVMTPFKFEPSQIRVNEGDTVVIRLLNADPAGRVHNVASRYLLTLPLVLRGDAYQGVNEERRWIAVDAGKRGEFEFVARGRGSYPFICDITIHAFLGQAGALFVDPGPIPE